MFARIVMLVLGLMPTVMALRAADTAPPARPYRGKPLTFDFPRIKLLIAHDVKDAVIEVTGKHRLFDPHSQTYRGVTRYVGKKPTPIEVTKEGLKWGEEFPDLYQIQIQPACSNTAIVVNGIEYKGLITIYNIDRNSQSISIINELPIEDYLAYFLPGSYPDAWPIEALAAAAIVARTNAYFQIQNSKTPFWTIDARQMGYQGSADKDPANPMRKAIAQTRSMVLSQTGAYEGVVTPFPAFWRTPVQKIPPHLRQGLAQISLTEGVEMAEKGAHAGTILGKAFPFATIQLIP
jgi:stage II sporulation protein D